LDDWHIVSRSNRRTRDVRTGTPAHIWNSTQHTLANDFDDTGAVEAAQKVECVAAADNYRVRSFDGAAHITPVVNGLDVIAQRMKARIDSREVLVLREPDRREWHKEHATHGNTEELFQD